MRSVHLQAERDAGALVDAPPAAFSSLPELAALRDCLAGPPPVRPPPFSASEPAATAAVKRRGVALGRRLARCCGGAAMIGYSGSGFSWLWTYGACPTDGGRIGRWASWDCTAEGAEGAPGWGGLTGEADCGSAAAAAVEAAAAAAAEAPAVLAAPELATALLAATGSPVRPSPSAHESKCIDSCLGCGQAPSCESRPVLCRAARMTLGRAFIMLPRLAPKCVQGPACSAVQGQTPEPLLQPALGWSQEAGAREGAFALLARLSAADPPAAAAVPLGACLLARLRAADAGVAADAAAAAPALLPACGLHAPHVVAELLVRGVAGALPQWRMDMA